jgi:hypothetical protein
VDAEGVRGLGPRRRRAASGIPGADFTDFADLFWPKKNPDNCLYRKCLANESFKTLQTIVCLPWRRGQVVSSPPSTEETEAMGREIESRQGIRW